MTKPQKQLTMPCPWCNETLRAHTDASGVGLLPKAGDVTVCFYCAEVSMFADGDGLLRKMTPEESANILSDPDVADLAMRIRLKRGLW